MATYYVSSVDGNNADTGASWALAKATVAGALAVATTTGDIILVDSAHAYDAGGNSITWNASSGIHVSIISTDRVNGGALAGASERCGTGSGGYAFYIATANAQTLYIQGMTIEPSTTSNDATVCVIASAQPPGVVGVTMKNCTLLRQSGNDKTTFQLGTTAASNARLPVVVLDGCTFKTTSITYPSNTPFLRLGAAAVEIIGCSTVTTAGTTPTKILNGGAQAAQGHFGDARIIDCDFSATACADTVDIGGTWYPIEFVNCKFHASTTLVPTGTWLAGAASVSYVNCDSCDTEYKYAHYSREGALTVDTATYASDPATVAGTSLSWKIVTTASAIESSPFVTPWVSTWIDSTGSKTLSLELVYDSATNLTDREVWAEFEYLGNASYPLGTVVSTRNANPFTGTGTDLTAGSATWTEAMANDNKDKITTTVTVNGKGLARARLFVAKASQTLYVDPQLRVA